ncbi:hypothetical protein [Gloeobacter kilaueensis]|uniref:Uncharacterized protein n=1 Tax=Gloeobacter kilaueensis (strain ATCC BAA-2537 / CCAP 1431/1 / ULC 316 / JS1) TaxID=1183438 RepID=U5QHB8_GLOK1|nr:hypothetical protein [Gloeobacter kilaueensis]AGY57029.1 hypothetical protein GKIL_0783 [Gloeobacter kilaueensis JS1]
MALPYDTYTYKFIWNGDRPTALPGGLGARGDAVLKPGSNSFSGADWGILRRHAAVLTFLFNGSLVPDPANQPDDPSWWPATATSPVYFVTFNGKNSHTFPIDFFPIFKNFTTRQRLTFAPGETKQLLFDTLFALKNDPTAVGMFTSGSLVLAPSPAYPPPGQTTPTGPFYVPSN